MPIEIKEENKEKDGKTFTSLMAKINTKVMDVGEKLTFTPKGFVSEGTTKYGKWYLMVVEIDGKEVKTFQSEGSPFLRICKVNEGTPVTIEKVMKENKSTGNPYYTLEVLEGNKPKPKGDGLSSVLKSFSEIEDEEDNSSSSSSSKRVKCPKEYKDGKIYYEDELIDFLLDQGAYNDYNQWFTLFNDNGVDEKRIEVLFNERTKQ